MELGQRLRQARIEQGLSQRQLCGDVITRNMLSQIENGSARPSMDTLSYLSARLNKPISFFLEEDGASIPNLRIMEQARKYHAEQNWPQLLSKLQQYREEDGVFDAERWLLQALCLMELAAEATRDGRSIYARQLLEETAEAGKRTPYYTDELERRRLLLLAEASGKPTALPCDDRALLLRAQQKMTEGKPDLAAALLDSCDDCSCARWHRLRGEAAYQMADYRDAIAHFQQADEPCYQRLEQCYRALEDYKMAYEYACKQRENSE